MKVLTILLLLISLYGYSQEGKITILVEGEEVVCGMKNCYKKGKIIRTGKGREFKIVIWGGYAPWSKEYSLITRSLDGKYSTNIQLCDLTTNIEINFNSEL